MRSKKVLDTSLNSGLGSSCFEHEEEGRLACVDGPRGYGVRCSMGSVVGDPLVKLSGAKPRWAKWSDT